MKYQSATVNGQPINASGNNAEPIAMVSNNKTIAISPSTLGTDGESFTTTMATNSSSLTQGFRVPNSFWRPNERRFSWGW